MTKNARSISAPAMSTTIKPKPYGSGPESDQVGYAFRNSANEWRIEFPAPYYESNLDIIEFKR